MDWVFSAKIIWKKIFSHYLDVIYYMILQGNVWLPVEHTPSSKGVPTSAMFSDGIFFTHKPRP